MSECDRLREWQRSGNVHFLGNEAPCLYDFSRALAQKLNMSFEKTSGRQGLIDGLCSKIEDSRHIVLILIDAMGMCFIDRLEKHSFLGQKEPLVLKSVFPSGTSAALTTLATAVWPVEHGIHSWNIFLKKHNLSVQPLPFVESVSERPLKEFNVSDRDVFLKPSLPRSAEFKHLFLHPAQFEGSVYTTYFCGSGTRVGYQNLNDAVAKTIELTSKAVERTFLYFYFPVLDSLCHEKGPAAPSTLECLKSVNRAIERIARVLSKDVRMLVTADHGQIDSSPEPKMILEPDDPLLAMLNTFPTGEKRTPIFHVKEGHDDEFKKAFLDRFGDEFVLLTSSEIFSLGLFGDSLTLEKLEEEAKNRLGTFWAIPKHRGTIYCNYPQKKQHKCVGHHGGLSSDEMFVPLYIL